MTTRPIALWVAAWATAVAAPVDFNRDVRPILSDRCYTCHGPDSAKRTIPLRFDQEASAKSDLGGGRHAIVPGDPGRSELFRRVTSDKPALRMPPVASGAALTEAQIATLRQWIAEGALWQKHWSLIPPKPLETPAVRRRDWPKQPLDVWVLARLEKESLEPSPEAGKATLLRRVSLDLTGLPPTPDEVNAFLADTSSAAYDKVVDRLLASPRYGERMAAPWLDAARYADTNGYQTDAERFMWRWRDWVIEAFNRNLPFDQFTVEQLAGDLLPNPTLDQLIATGFNRNHRGNGEGGIIPEEYAVEYVVDRVETTSTVWLGLTVGCARCHDHKYDPISQKEFYQLYAYFNSIPEKGKVWKYGNSPPLIPAPTPEQLVLVREVEQQLAAAQSRFDGLAAEIAKAQRTWERGLTPDAGDWTIEENRVAVPPAEEDFDGSRAVDGGNIGRFGFYDRFTLAARITPKSLTGAILTKAEDVDEGQGYSLVLRDGRVQANLVQRWLDDAIRVETERALEPGRTYHVAFTYDGSRVADGTRIYIDGKPEKLRYLLDDLNQSFDVRAPFRIGGGLAMPFSGRIADVRVYSAGLSDEEAGIISVDEPLSQLARVDPSRRTKAQADKLRRAFLGKFASLQVRHAWAGLYAAQKLHKTTLENLPTVMVMQELPEPRQAHVLIRGSYERPGEKVARGVPASLPALPSEARSERLGLARWLVSPNHPLTARVIVNRFWQMLFGAGIVRTVEDFGSQGDPPSHPEMLDMLASEFVAGGWNVKALLKSIVTSATYRQSSRMTRELLERDPGNRLLARGPRFRLPAEMVRDQALFASGLLVEKLGGPSVKPYQPAGLWRELSGGGDYVADQGEGLWRRSLYTFWKRASPPPGMSTFDAAGRETCIVRESRTNTPLQALTLMNDVTYLEAARKLAERVIREAPPDPDARILLAFRLLTSRGPEPAEMAVLRANFQNAADRFRSIPSAAAEYLKQGKAPRDEKLDPSALAAYTSVASLILNLDEVITRQ